MKYIYEFIVVIVRSFLVFGLVGQLVLDDFLYLNLLLLVGLGIVLEIAGLRIVDSIGRGRVGRGRVGELAELEHEILVVLSGASLGRHRRYVLRETFVLVLATARVVAAVVVAAVATDGHCGSTIIDR